MFQMKKLQIPTLSTVNFSLNTHFSYPVETFPIIPVLHRTFCPKARRDFGRFLTFVFQSDGKVVNTSSKLFLVSLNLDGNNISTQFALYPMIRSPKWVRS